jgi:cell division protease FtsH
MEDFTQAVERIVAGLEKRNRLLNPKEREIVAYHELGHAMVATSLPGTDPVHKISIIPRGVGALGYTVQRPIEDRFLMTREELDNKMAVLLGGRAAEWVVFKHLSTGAADDLAKATDIARAMVTRYGMSEELGHVALEKDQRSFLSPMLAGPRERDFSDQTAAAIDKQVREILEQALERAVTILTRNRVALERAAKRLLEKETLDENELKDLLQPNEQRIALV